MNIKFRYFLIFSLFFFSCKSSNYKFYCNVDRIIDGDTVVCNSKKIRLANIDTLETRRGKRFYKSLSVLNLSENEALFYAKKAKSFLESTINNKKVLVSVTQERDYYKRIVGYIFFKQLNINFELVNQGLALPDIFVDDQYSKIIVNLCLNAQRYKVGIWEKSKGKCAS